MFISANPFGLNMCENYSVALYYEGYNEIKKYARMIFNIDWLIDCLISFTDSLFLLIAELLTSSEHYTKILCHVTSSWLLGNALIMSSLVLFHRSYVATREDTTNALPSNHVSEYFHAMFHRSTLLMKYNESVDESILSHRRGCSVTWGTGHFWPKIYVWKMNKMPEFYMILPEKYFPKFLGKKTLPRLLCLCSVMFSHYL